MTRIQFEVAVRHLLITWPQPPIERPAPESADKKGIPPMLLAALCAGAGLVVGTRLRES